MTTLTDTPPPTPAEETIANAMIIALLTCLALSYSFVHLFNLTTITGYLGLALTTFVITGYVVPHLTAWWLGRPLTDIMTDNASSPD